MQGRDRRWRQRRKCGRGDRRWIRDTRYGRLRRRCGWRGGRDRGGGAIRRSRWRGTRRDSGARAGSDHGHGTRDRRGRGRKPTGDAANLTEAVVAPVDPVPPSSHARSSGWTRVGVRLGYQCSARARSRRSRGANGRQKRGQERSARLAPVNVDSRSRKRPGSAVVRDVHGAVARSVTPIAARPPVGSRRRHAPGRTRSD